MFEIMEHGSKRNHRVQIPVSSEKSNKKVHQNTTNLSCSKQKETYPQSQLIYICEIKIYIDQCIKERSLKKAKNKASLSRNKNKQKDKETVYQ